MLCQRGVQRTRHQPRHRRSEQRGRHQGQHQRVAIDHFHDDDESGFPVRIIEQIRSFGLSPACFELELTESGMMQNITQATELVAQLSAAGFAIAIDDFGTGYSSLTYLKRLPAHKLKIDQSFVRTMLEERNDHAIVTTIIAMGRTLGLSIMAEGVERQDQADALLALGCDEAQGYLFAKPATAADFARQWLGRQGDPVTETETV